MMTFDGRLKDVVTVEKLTETQEDSGKVTRGWASQGTRRAQVETLFGRKLLEAQTEAATTDTEVIMRRFDGLIPTQYRFTFGTRTLRIIRVVGVELRHRFMQVFCKEEVVV